ncbi:MAG: hypothetical protein KDE33_05660 [Bacteroidetes bacterium]|nr:hypothetical protein [Bacteroidota bacterium]
MKSNIIQEINKEFKAVSKKEWLAKVTKDLKGKPFSEIEWQLDAETKFEPIYTKEDIAGFNTGILKNYNPDWQIGEIYNGNTYLATNQQLLEDLNHGLNAPVFNFETLPNVADFGILFNGVGLEHIYLHFVGNEMRSNFLAFLKEKNIDESDVKVSFLSEANNVDARAYYKGKSNVKQEIQKAINETKSLFEKAENKQDLANTLSFVFYVDNAYLLSIAKLRAFKLKYVELLKEYGLEPKLPFIYGVFAPDAYGKDEQDNLINATSMAMSAVLGGVNHLIVRPTAETTTAKRLARNIQLILKHESGLHQITDPANGSYYIESLTEKLLR